MIKVGHKIKLQRKNKKITQQELADHLGVRRETILHLEKDRHAITFENAIKISLFLGCSLDDLYEKEEQSD